MTDRTHSWQLGRIVLACWVVLVCWVSWDAGYGTALAAEAASTAPPAALSSLDDVVAKLPHFTVAGKVVDKGGQAVEAAEVFLYYPGSESGLRGRLAGQVRSGKDGAFRFENAGVWEPPMEGGRSQRDIQKYYIIARHPQHGIEFAVLLKGEAADNVLVRMQEAQKYTVVVKDTAGKPVAGARAFVFNGQHSDALNKQIAAEHPENVRQYQYLMLGQDIGLSSGTTDAEGKVSLLGPADAGFMAVKEGYAKGFSGDANVILCPGAKVSGRVTWPDGSPAAGVGVLFEYQGQRLVHNDATTTDAQGRYHLDYLPGSGYYWAGIPPEAQKGQGTGTLRVQDLRPGSTLTSTKMAFPINPGGNLTKDLSFQQALVLAGKVVDLDSGQPLSGICLSRYIQTAGTPYLDGAELTTDADGRFSTSVPPGSQVSFQWQRSNDGGYLIDTEWQQGNPDGYQPFREEKLTKGRTDLVFKLKLIALQSLSGRVVDENGQGVRGAAIYIHPELKEARSDANGAFTLKAFKNRDFDLCAVTNDRTLGGLVHLKAGATQTLVSLAKTVSYDGQVTTPDDLPAGKLKFYLDLRLNGQNLYRVREEPTTDAAGKFKAPNLIPGAAYYAWWRVDQDENRDYDHGNATIELSQIKPGEPIRFKATQFLNALMGKVVDEKGKPIAGATVDAGEGAVMPQDARMNRKPIVTDAKGEFSIGRLAPGTITLHITATGHKGGNFKSATDAIDFVAALKSGDQSCTWEIAVVDEGGKAVPGARLILWQQRYDGGKAKSDTRSLQADAEGKLRLTAPVANDMRNMPAVIAADAPGCDLAFAALAINEDVRVRLVVRKSGKHWRGVVVDANNKPVAGAAIRVSGMQTEPGNYRSHIVLYDRSDASADPFGLSTTSDGQGRFEVPRLSADSWTNVAITAPGHAALQSYFDPSRDQGEKTMRLPAAAVIEGVVRMPDGQPAVGAKVSLGYFGTPAATSITDKDGRYVLSGFDVTRAEMQERISAEAGGSPPQWEGHTTYKGSLRAGEPVSGMDIVLKRSFVSRQAEWKQQPGKPLASKYAVAILEDADPAYSGKTHYDDLLCARDSSGTLLWQYKGLNVCQGNGRGIAADPRNGAVWVVENVGKRLLKFSADGTLAWEKPDVKGQSLCIDPKTGNAWVLTIDRVIYGDRLLVFSPDGQKLQDWEIQGLDIAYSPHDDCFWIAGRKLLKVGRDGKMIQESPVSFAWTATSVAVDERDGAVWVVEGYHPQVRGSEPRVVVVNPDGQLRKAVAVEGRSVQIDGQRRCAWVGGFEGLVKLDLDGSIIADIPVRGSLCLEPDTGYVWAAGEEGLWRLDTDGHCVWSTTTAKTQKWMCVIPR